VPQRVGLDRPVLGKAVLHAPAQLVALARDLGRGALAQVGPALEYEDFHAFRGELPRSERGSQAAADEHDVALRELGSH